jgi:hypothetical protein
MWGIILIAFGVLVVFGSLLLGWGIPFIALFGVLLIGAAAFFLFQRTVAEPTTGVDDDADSKPSWQRKHWWQ